MLFQSSVEVILNSIYWQTMSKSANIRKADTEKRIDFYNDVQAAYILEALSKYFNDVTKFTPTFINIVKKIINNVATTYIQDAQRKIEGTERDQAIFNQIALDSSLDIKWKLASRYTKLLKTIIVRVVWRKDHIDIDILTGDILDIKTGDTPEDLKSVMITHYPESGKKEDIEYSVWTDTEFKRLDYRGNVINRKENPYLILPFVPVFDYAPSSAFWLDGGGDIISAQESINQALTDLLYVVRQQGFGQAVAKGLSDDSGNLNIGPNVVVELPADKYADFKYEATKAPIKACMDFINYLIQQTAIANGLSSSTLSTKPSQQNGTSKLIDNSELREQRRSDIALFNTYEKRLFEIIKVVHNTHTTDKKLSESSRLKVDFYEVKTANDPRTQAETWRELLAMGAIGLCDIVIERNPDLNREDALKYLSMIHDEHKKLNVTSPAQAQKEE